MIIDQNNEMYGKPRSRFYEKLSKVMIDRGWVKCQNTYWMKQCSLLEATILALTLDAYVGDWFPICVAFVHVGEIKYLNSLW